MAPEGGGHAGGDSTPQPVASNQQQQQTSGRPLILITEPQNSRQWPQLAEAGNQRHDERQHEQQMKLEEEEAKNGGTEDKRTRQPQDGDDDDDDSRRKQEKKGKENEQQDEQQQQQEEDQFEVVDGISYRIVAAVTTKKRPPARPTQRSAARGQTDEQSTGGEHVRLATRSASFRTRKQSASQQQQPQSRLSVMRRKSSAFVANLSSFLVPNSRSSHELGGENGDSAPRPRRMSIYEMTKSPPPETSIEMYLNERRRSSTVSAKFVQQQLEQQSTFETNYCARQQYFKDLNEKLINQDKRLLNVVANRGQMHRHSVDIAQLPLELAQANAAAARKLAAESETLDELQEEQENEQELGAGGGHRGATNASQPPHPATGEATINQVQGAAATTGEKSNSRTGKQLASICEHAASGALPTNQFAVDGSKQVGDDDDDDHDGRRHVVDSWKLSERRERPSRGQVIKKKFAQFDGQSLASAPAPDVKIGQRVAYKEYYGNEFGTIRWIGRVPQISAEWTVGVEFDNAIGEGDGSLHGRRYFIAKDCFAKFLPLANVALVDQHVGRPEPGTMISVMSAAVRPGQMISIQRVSTVHVQHCFLNAPHRRPGAEFLAINTRLHCQCPNCGPCAHVVKPPRTQRLRTPKNATHMCQFSTYTCCGMESSEDALCTYTGNKISSLPPPGARQNSLSLPPVAGSWIEGAGYLSTLQAEQRKLMPEEYRIGGAAPDDVVPPTGVRRNSSGRRRRQHHEGVSPQAASPMESTTEPAHHSRRHHSSESHSKRHHHHHHHHHKHRRKQQRHLSPPPVYSDVAPEVNYPSALEVESGGGGESQALAISPMDKPTKWANSYDAHEQAAPDGTEEPLKPQRIVYRDSIENRYLFPTDDVDVIDSTLEQDLEDLSLARYGYLRNPNRNHTRSCSSNNSRNLLVKSLRSLVSCLSANRGGGGGSDIETNYQSANTMRIVADRPLSGGATPVNKSRPMLMANGCGVGAHSASFGSWRSHSPISSSSCSSSCSSPAKNHFQHQRLYEPLNTAKYQLVNGHAVHETPPLVHQAIVPATLGGQPVRRQVSSSSDCGFSSASQNSTANCVPAHSSSGIANSFTGQLDELERHRLGAIYERLAARLIQSSTSSSPVTSEDLLKLRNSLFELRAQSPHFDTGTQLDCCEQLLTELIKKSVLKQRTDSKYIGQQQQQATPSSDGEITNRDAEQGRATEEGVTSTSGLPRAFELKLTLSINENAKRQPQDDAGGLTSATNGAASAEPSFASTASNTSEARSNVNFSLVTPAVAAGAESTAT